MAHVGVSEIRDHIMLVTNNNTKMSYSIIDSPKLLPKGNTEC